MRDALDRALRADRHERRRLDVAVRGRHDAAPRTAVGVGDSKREGGTDIGLDQQSTVRVVAANQRERMQK